MLRTRTICPRAGVRLESVTPPRVEEPRTVQFTTTMSEEEGEEKDVG